jgi:hypothetical protein
VIILFEEKGKLYRFDGYEDTPGFKPNEPGICSLEQVDPTSLKPLNKYEEVHVHDCLRAIAEIRNEIMESSPCIDFVEFFERIKSLRKLQKQSKKVLERPAYQMIVDEREDKLDALLSRIDKLTGGAE